MTTRSLSIFAALLCNSALADETRHVVVVVWDGMRPDFVSEQNTPTLWQLAKDGVVFRNHHSVYPSATNVNGTAIATGVYPGHSGIIANHVYRSDIDVKKSVDVESANVVRKGDELSHGKYIAVPTIAALVQNTGGQTAIATAKTVGLLLDRHVGSVGKNSATIFAGAALPFDILGPIVKVLGPFPPAGAAAQRDAWTTKALIDFLWRDQLPAFSLLWLGEPDDTQHKTAPGAPPALAAVKTADDNLAAVLTALDRHHARESTDVFVVSDHGFSTVARANDLRPMLKKAGFNVAEEFQSQPKTGDIIIVGNGGSVLFYVIEHDAKTTQRLVEFLQQSDFAGVVFTKQPMTGTFTLAQGKIDNVNAPDVVMAFRWTDSQNQFGIPGMIDADWQRGAGKGTHATLGRFDMHNTLIASGPDFGKGLTSDLPSGNVDLAPTILHILGIAAPEMDGRVLFDKIDKSTSETIETTNEFPAGKWRQHLRISRVRSTTYLDEGNGEFVASKTEHD